MKKIVIDCGAHLGEAADFFLKKYPNALFHLFEASPKVIDRLREKYKNYNNITVHQKAV